MVDKLRFIEKDRKSGFEVLYVKPGSLKRRISPVKRSVAGRNDILIPLIDPALGFVKDNCNPL